MNSTTPRNSRGTISLVALCFVVVIGIVLGSYLTLCSRAMNLSNRSYQAGVAQQLAEFGLEEGLRAFNKNDWSGWASNPSNVTGANTAWTIDAAKKRASRTIAFGSGKLGQGLTATVKIRIDNYNAAQLESQYSSTATYRINDLVGRNGIWYRSVQDNHSGNTPNNPAGNLDYWVPEPIPWKWSNNISYSQFDIVSYNGTWHRSNISSNTSTPPTNWTPIPTLSLSWNSSTPYTAGSFVYHTGNNTWYRCTSNHTGLNPAIPANNPNPWSTLSSPDFISWAWRYSPAVTYRFNDVVYHAGKWWRCTNNYTSNDASDYPGSASAPYWEDALTGAWGWDSSNRVYNLGEVVYHNSSSRWYRCTLAHTSTSALPLTPGTSAGAAYWSDSPLFSTAWDSGRQYGVNDIVAFNGVWYRCLVANNNSRPTPSNTNWASAASSSNQWSATATYTANTSYVSYGGTWYKCITAPTASQSPNNTDYWTPSWKNSWQPNSTDVMGAAVIYAEASVTIANSPPIRTQLRAAINPAALFPNALAANTTIQTSAAGTIDSYDSGVDSATGPYPSGFSAVVAAGNTGSTGISLASTIVQGYLAAPPASSSPYAPLVTSGGSLKNSDGSVTSPPPSGNPNLDLTRISRSPNIPQFDTVPLGSGGLSATWGFSPPSLPLVLSSTINIGTPGATTPTRYYYGSHLNLSSSSPTILNINGPVVLYIRGNLILDGSGSPNGVINITSAGSAEIHLSGALRVNPGSDGINNTTRDPKKLVIISDTAGVTTQNYSDGTTPFYGVIYMPYTTSSSGLELKNSTTMQIYGAISAKKITYSVDANVHYDTSLRYATIPGVDQPYAVTDWRILPVVEQATMP